MASEPRRTKRWERKRDEILTVAEQVFGERAFAGTRLEGVAERMDIQRPSLVLSLVIIGCSGVTAHFPGR